MDLKLLGICVVALIVFGFVFAVDSSSLPGQLVVEPGKSVSYYLKSMNANILLGGSQASSTEIILPKGTSEAPVQSPGVVPGTLNPGVSSSQNVIVNKITYKGANYYSVVFKRGFLKGTDNFCIDASDKLIPGFNINHGKYCFSISDWDVVQGTGEIMNIKFTGTRVPVANSDSRTELDCDWSPSSTAANIQTGSSLLGYSFNCGIQEQGYFGSNEIEKAVTLDFSDNGAIQYSDGSIGAEIKIGLLTSANTFTYYPSVFSSDELNKSLTDFTFAPSSESDVSYDLLSGADSQIGIVLFAIKDSDYDKYNIVNSKTQAVIPSKKVGSNLYRVLMFGSVPSYAAVAKDSSTTLPAINPLFIVTTSSTDNEWNDGDSYDVQYFAGGAKGEYSAKSVNGKFISTTSDSSSVFGDNPFTIRFVVGSSTKSITLDLQDNLIFQDRIIIKSIN
jgi:hypothetical protein